MSANIWASWMDSISTMTCVRCEATEFLELILELLFKGRGLQEESLTKKVEIEVVAVVNK